MGVHFAYVPIRFWNCSDGVVYLVLHFIFFCLQFYYNGVFMTVFNFVAIG